MPNTSRPIQAIKTLQEIGQTQEKIGKNEEELLDEVNRLRNKQNAWDHYIFDLKGSTGYRRRYGAEAGLMKAFLHNRTVSDAVSWAGGRVVKWMGDGVLGLFALDECGTDHPFKALSAALVALNEIKALNGKEPLRRLVSVASTDEYERADHEVHTKVALCSGALHFFDLAANEPSRSSNIAATPGVPSVGDMSSTLSQAVSPIPVLGTDVRDPMGSVSIWQHAFPNLAEADVILVDEDTFWGHTPKDDKGASLLPSQITGVCQIPKDEISWRRFDVPTRNRAGTPFMSHSSRRFLLVQAVWTPAGWSIPLMHHYQRRSFRNSLCGIVDKTGIRPPLSSSRLTECRVT